MSGEKREIVHMGIDQDKSRFMESFGSRAWCLVRTSGGGNSDIVSSNIRQGGMVLTGVLVRESVLNGFNIQRSSNRP